MKTRSNIQITNEDNMDLMARYPDNYFDLAIVDPPYGIGRDSYETGSKSSKAWKNPKKRVYAGNWDKAIPEQEYWNELFRISKNQIVWGGNYFIPFLKPSMGVIAWDKKVNGNFSEFEMAWTSFNQRARIFEYMWNGYRKQDYEERFHPTQKPVKLYKWLLSNYAREGDKILDTHLGSGSIAIACDDLGFDLVACELDKDYFDAAINRLEVHRSQLKMF